MEDKYDDLDKNECVNDVYHHSYGGGKIKKT